MRIPSCVSLFSAACAVLLLVPAARSADLPEAFAEARAALAARDYDRAAALLEPAATGSAPSAATCAMLAQARLGQKKTRDAAAWAEKATELEPNNAAYHALLGSALGQRIGEIPFLQQAFVAGKLRRAFARTVELEPNNLSGLIGLSRYHANAPAIAGGDTGKAREFAERVRQIDPYLGWLELGHVAEKDEDAAQALAAYEEAEKLKPGNPAVSVRLARALIALGRPAEAESRLAQIPTDTVHHREAQKLLAQVRAPEGKRAP